MGKKEKNKKVIIGISCGLLVAILIGVFVGYRMFLNKEANKNKEKDEITTNNKNAFLDYNDAVEYGSRWSYDEFLKKVVDQGKVSDDTEIVLTLAGDVLTSNDVYTFDSLGEHTLLVELKYKYKTETFGKEEVSDIKVDKTYFLTVVDTVAPVISGIADKTIMEGESIDLEENLKAVDAVDGEVEVILVGEVDTKKAGTYKIEVSAEDKSGNKATGEFNVTVNKKITTTKPTTTTTRPKTTKTTTTKKVTTTTAPANDESTKTGRLNLAKQEAKRVASQIIKPGMSDEEKAYAIFVYLYSNVRLQTNQSNEAYKTNFGNEAYAALVMKIAACSGFCKAVTLLCNEAGLQSQHVNANQWTHQWNRVLINGEWIVLDAQGGIFGGTVHPLE